MAAKHCGQSHETAVQRCPHLIEAADSQHILIVQGGLVVDPLPHLGAPNLSSGCILHEIVQGHTAHAPQPGLQVLHPHTDVVPQAGFCSVSLRHLQHTAPPSQPTGIQRKPPLGTAEWTQGEDKAGWAST